MGNSCRLVVLTGGPGAGKTAAVQILQKLLSSDVAVLPEAASILYGGGFGRTESVPSRKAAQRAIFHVQRQLEARVLDEKNYSIALCDRGTVDGLAYWPSCEDSFWDELGSTRVSEFARYSMVIHLRTPSQEHGYNYQNPCRTESAEEARMLDERIFRAWEGHPRRVVIDSMPDFLEKVATVLHQLRDSLPSHSERVEQIFQCPKTAILSL